MPFSVLCAMVLVLCLVGGFAPSQKLHDVWLILAFGVGGYLLRKADYPLASLVLALLLGPLMEKNLRRAMALSGGEWGVLFDSPIALTLWAMAGVSLVAPALLRRWTDDGTGPELPVEESVG